MWCGLILTLLSHFSLANCFVCVNEPQEAYACALTREETIHKDDTKTDIFLIESSSPELSEEARFSWEKCACLWRFFDADASQLASRFESILTHSQTRTLINIWYFSRWAWTYNIFPFRHILGFIRARQMLFRSRACHSTLTIERRAYIRQGLCVCSECVARGCYFCDIVCSDRHRLYELWKCAREYQIKVMPNDYHRIRRYSICL